MHSLPRNVTCPRSPCPAPTRKHFPFSFSLLLLLLLILLLACRAGAPSEGGCFYFPPTCSHKRAASCSASSLGPSINPFRGVVASRSKTWPRIFMVVPSTIAKTPTG